MNAINNPQRDMVMWHRINQTCRCLSCSVDGDGRPKVNHGAKSGYDIRDTAENDHLTTRAHQTRIGQARHLHPDVRGQARFPGSVFTPRIQVADVRYYCRVCSLDKWGGPRNVYRDIAAAGAVDHVTSPDHLRRANRLLDPRFGLWQATGIPWHLP